MPNLFDTFFGDPDQTRALGLLGIGMQRGNFGGGAEAAMSLLADAPRKRMQQQLMEAQLAETLAQGRQREIQAQREQAQLERQSRINAELPNLFKAPGMTGGEAVPQQMGGVPMFSQPMGVTPMRSTPGGFDVQRAISLGLDPKTIQEYAGLQNIGRPKASRQMEVDDGKGGKRIALVDDFGQEVAGFAGYTAPVQVNQGDRVSFVKPAPGVNLPVNMSPDAKASNALGWANNALTRRGQDMTDARAREQIGASKAPAGYRFKPDGTMEVIPGGPADMKAGADGQKRVSEAKDVLMLLDEVDTLLPQSTGSYTGAGIDLIAGGVFGKSTKGAEAMAQLKALQGALVAKMPKMTGPQSDKDVLLYREMAGQVGDPTIPVPQRQAAARMIRRLNEKYAGVPEGSSNKAPGSGGLTPQEQQELEALRKQFGR